MDDTQVTSPVIPDEVTKLKKHLDDKGIKYTWLSEQIGKERTWITQLFGGRMEMSPEIKSSIENKLGITL